MTEKLYHVTVLSNFARAFDKYSMSYCKDRIPESTFPNRFFLLRRNELQIGIQKAGPLLEKLSLPGNSVIVLETEVDPGMLEANTVNGRGQFIRSNRITLSKVHDVEDCEPIELRPLAVEDAMAASLRLLNGGFHAFKDIRPRAISFLPVALACQAKCPFCFSKASISRDQAAAKPDWERVQLWLARARANGAERAVITGGGEPTLLGEDLLLQLISGCAGTFEKTVLITNGYVLATWESGQFAGIRAFYDAGLRVLAISRHHYDPEYNRRLMHLDTPVENLIHVWNDNRRRWPNLRLRLIGVLQKGGIEDEGTLARYVSWAVKQGVEELCLKELYVSTSAESVYHDRSANAWSRQHQVPLSLVTDFADRQGFIIENRLPWGAPIYRGQWHGKPVQIAAYTEPSLFWERTHGIARSWNVMADGQCHVSLEDRASKIELEEFQ
jgi:hypothetical protein